MTDLSPLEPAARTLCQLRGLDPDEVMLTPHPLIIGQHIEFPQWHETARELLMVTQCLTALKMNAPQKAQEH